MATMPTMAKHVILALSQSVGVRGRNLAPDAIRVQDALNCIPQSEGAPATLLSLDGVVGPKTCEAIRKLQLHHFGFRGADGRIDPGGRTAQLISALLVRHGSTQWNIRRLESSVAAGGNMANERTVDSADRFFLIHDVTGARRVLYFCTTLANPIIARDYSIPPLVDRQEFCMFNTLTPCGPFSFVGFGTYVEFSPDANHAAIALTVQPVAAHVNDGPYTFQIKHQWIKPISTPGARTTFSSAFQFVRDESPGEKKVPRR
jgi:hypothetical protein